MKCPKCGHTQVNDVECTACGIIFSKFQQRKDRITKQGNSTSSSSTKKKTWLLITGALLLGIAGGKFLFSDHQKTGLQSTRQEIHNDRIDSPSIEEFQPNKNSKFFHDQREASSNLSGLSKEIAANFPSNNDIEKAQNATVYIKTPWGSGSGFFIDELGHIISNRHVVQFDQGKLNRLRKEVEDLRNNLADEEKNLAYYRNELKLIRDKGQKERFLRQIENREKNYSKYFDLHETLKQQLSELDEASTRDEIKVVSIDGHEFNAEIVSMSDNRDLVLLRIYAEDTPYLSAANSPLNFAQGQKVYTIGNPAGLKHTVTSGIISGFRSIEGKNMIQTDAPINPGNSGGPLIDERGRIIGVNTMIMKDTEGIGFAIPIQEVYKDFSYYLSDN